VPYKLNVDPILTNDLTDIVDPIIFASRSERVDPILHMPYMLIELPTLM
jgi:hypothetical protein